MFLHNSVHVHKSIETDPSTQVHAAPVTYSYADPRGEKDESIKIVIVGAPGVGKTAIAQVRENITD